MKRTTILISSILFIAIFVFISNARTDTAVKPAVTCWQTICVTVDGKYADCKVKIYDRATDQMVLETETGEDGCVDVELTSGVDYYATGWCGTPVIYHFTACTLFPVVLVQ